MAAAPFYADALTILHTPTIRGVSTEQSSGGTVGTNAGQDTASNGNMSSASFQVQNTIRSTGNVRLFKHPKTRSRKRAVYSSAAEQLTKSFVRVVEDLVEVPGNLLAQSLQ